MAADWIEMSRIPPPESTEMDWATEEVAVAACPAQEEKVTNPLQKSMVTAGKMLRAGAPTMDSIPVEAVNDRRRMRAPGVVRAALVPEAAARRVAQLIPAISRAESPA